MMEPKRNRAFAWVTTQDLEERLDATHYEMRALDTDRRLRNCSGGSMRLGTVFGVTKLSGFEYSKYFSKDELANGTVPCVMSTNVGTNELDLSSCIRISLETHRMLTRTQLSSGEIALSYTGHYRRAAVIPSGLGDLHLGPNVCKLKRRGNADPYFLAAYLNSSTGQTLLDRQKTLSAQPTVAMDRIRGLPVPYPDPGLQRAIGNKVRKAERLRKLAKAAYAHVNIWLSEYGFFADGNVLRSGYMSALDLSDRLDSLHYRSDLLASYRRVTNHPNVHLGDNDHFSGLKDGDHGNTGPECSDTGWRRSHHVKGGSKGPTITVSRLLREGFYADTRFR